MKPRSYTHRWLAGLAGMVLAWLAFSSVPQAIAQAPEISIEQPAGTPLEDRRVVAWGANDYGQTTIPPGLSGVQAISAGYFHTVALKGNGTVVAWGYNGSGQTTIPAGLSGVVAIAAGGFHTAALKSNGSVVAWGRNDLGQTTIPAGLSSVQSISAGFYHTVALKSNGTVVAWGYNGFGQTTIPAGLSNVQAISAGYYHTVALKGTGTVVAWGDNNFGQTTIPTGLPGVQAIAAGTGYTVGLKTDGRVVAWGYNDSGQTTIPPGLSGVQAISAGYSHTVAVAGSVVSFANQEILTTSAAKLFSVKNLGTSALHISGVNLVSGNIEDFSVDTTGMLTTVPATTGQTSFNVTFHPTAGGTRQALLRVVNDDADEGSFTILLKMDAPLYPEIAVFNGNSTAAADERTDNVGTLVLPATNVGSTSSQTFTISNVGTAALTGLALSKSGANATELAYTALSATSLAAGASMSFTVNFTPTAAGTRTATLAIGSNDADENPFDLNLSITGVTPELSVFNGNSTAAADERTDNVGMVILPATNAGAASGQTFTIKNIGLGTLTGLALSKSGTNASELTYATLSANSLAAGASITFTVIFTPTAVGTRTATLAIASNDVDENPFEINLSLNAATAPLSLLVTTLADEQDAPAGAAVSLREAVRDMPTGGVITFASGLLGQTLTLTRGEIFVSGKSITMQVPSQNVTISGNNASRILSIALGAGVDLQGLTLQNGQAPASENGGAINNAGRCTLTGCTLTLNRTPNGASGAHGTSNQPYGSLGSPGADGGAISNTGTLEIRQSRFTSNTAGNGGQQGAPGAAGYGIQGERGGSGGAIFNSSTGSLFIHACEFTGNQAGQGAGGFYALLTGGDPGTGGNGGAIASQGSLLISNSYFAANAAGTAGSNGGGGATPQVASGSGGAVDASTASLTNCTLSGNFSGAAPYPYAASRSGNGTGARIQAGRLIHCTLTANAVTSPQVANFPYTGGGAVSGTSALILENCVIAGNLANQGGSPPDINGTPTFAGQNLLGVSGTTAGPLNGTAAAPLAPGLLAAASNGGFTQTIRLAVGSPALNAAVPTPNTPFTDARGYVRVQGGAADLGALEMEGTLAPGAGVQSLTIGKNTTCWKLNWGTAAGTYVVQSSPSMAAGTWVNVAGLTITTDPNTSLAEALIPCNNSILKEFYRVLYTAPTAP